MQNHDEDEYLDEEAQLQYLDEEGQLQNLDEGRLQDLDDEAKLQNLASKFIGRVVYIESYRYRGYWLGVAKYGRSLYGKFLDVAEKDVVNDLRVKWRVVDVGGGNIALESVQYPNRYLDTHHSHWCKVTRTTYRWNKKWLKFKLEKRWGRYMFRSIRYSKYRLDAYHTKWAAIAKGKGIYAQFRIYKPKASEKYEKIAGFDNYSPTGVKYTFTEKNGITRTNGRSISTTLTTELGAEIKAAFTIGVSLSNTWTEHTSVTYSKETSHKVHVNVLPRHRLRVSQLVGSYAQFVVRAFCIRIEQKEINGPNVQVVYASSVEAYARGESLPPCEVKLVSTNDEHQLEKTYEPGNSDGKNAQPCMHALACKH